MTKIQNFFKNYNLENTRLENFSIIYVCIVILYLLIYNLWNYSIFYGYDADAHIAYVDYIAMYLPSNFKLPLEEHTYEYFSPPLPYLFPAIVQVICRNFSNSVDLVKYCQPIYGKFTQIFQTFLYVLSLFFYMKTLKIILNKKTIINFSFLILISTMAVNYRTILMIRGEPYIIFFLSLLLYLFTKIYNKKFEIKVLNILSFSLSLSAFMRLHKITPPGFCPILRSCNVLVTCRGIRVVKLKTLHSKMFPWTELQHMVGAPRTIMSRH